MKTFSLKKEDINKKWILIDAKNAVLGRLAVISANILRGKNKVNYTPHLDMSDYIIVINADKISLTGKKKHAKEYWSHSGFPGGSRVKTVKNSSPEFILYNSIKLYFGFFLNCFFVYVCSLSKRSKRSVMEGCPFHFSRTCLSLSLLSISIFYLYINGSFFFNSLSLFLYAISDLILSINLFIQLNIISLLLVFQKLASLILQHLREPCLADV